MSIFWKEYCSLEKFIIIENLHMSKRQYDAIKNQSRKPTTIDAGEISNNNIGDSRFDESHNQQIDE